MSDYIHQISQEETVRIQRFLRLAAVSVLVFVMIVVAAMLTIDRWLLLVSPASERRFVEPYISFANEHVLETAEPTLQAYVEGVAHEVAAQMGVNDGITLEVRTLKGDTLNAFATLGGYIFVFEGLVRALDNENSLAMVLGHEIAHARNRDPLLGAGRGMLLELMLSSLSGGSIDSSALDIGSELMLNTYSRDQEQAADFLAIAALHGHYGHVGGATELFEILLERGDTPQTVELLSSHPDLDARIEYLDSMAGEKGWVEKPTTPYPTAVQSILRD